MSPLYFFPEKRGDLFLVASSAVSSLVSSSKKPHGDLFLLIAITIAFYCFHSGVTSSRVSPHTFFTCSPLFFVNLTTIFSFGCHPLEGVTRDGPPSDATVCVLLLLFPIPVYVYDIHSSSLCTSSHLPNIHKFIFISNVIFVQSASDLCALAVILVFFELICCLLVSVR